MSELKQTVATNVMKQEEYKPRVKGFFGYVADSLTNTLGPCGAATMIDKYGFYSMTKDGFTVLKNIIIDDPIARNMLALMVEISNRMVRLCGDGSTTAVVGASKFINLFEESELKRLHSRQLTKVSNSVINKLVDKIIGSAVPVTSDNLLDVVYKTALVSTNWDEDFADMIKNIYSQKPNAVFNVTKSNKIGKTTYSIIDGYKIRISLIDKLYENMPGEFIGKNVKVVVFDHALTIHHYEMVKELHRLSMQGCDPNETTFVVMATGYEQNYMDLIQREVSQESQSIRAGCLRRFSKVYGRYSVFSGSSRLLFEDFAIMVGSQPIRIEDFNKMVDPLGYEKRELDYDILNAAIGGVEEIKMCEDYVIVKGFTKRDENKFNILKNDVTEKYQRLLNETMTQGFSTAEGILVTNRYRALSCNLAEIVVSGSNMLEKELNHDAADDATEACESVVENGYNYGNNLAIIKACRDLRLELVVSQNGSPEMNEMRMIDLIESTFKEVIRTIILNKYPEANDFHKDSNKVDDMKEKSLKALVPMNIITEELDENIINSSRTDIEILRGAISMAISIMSTNQYVASSAVGKLEF